MPTITAEQIAEDLRTLNATIQRFRNRAHTARRRNERIVQADAEAAAALFSRVTAIYRNAIHNGAAVSFRTSDVIKTAFDHPADEHQTNGAKMHPAIDRAHRKHNAAERIARKGGRND